MPSKPTFLSLLLSALFAVAFANAATAAPVYTVTTLAGPGVTSVPAGINNSGEVVGYTTVNKSRNAFVSNDGTLINLNPSTALASEAGAINDAGVVVGMIRLATKVNHAAVFANGTVTDLGSLGGAAKASQAYGINSSGQVTGMSYLAGSSNYHAFLYNPAGTMVDLGSLGGWSLGFDINETGTVVGKASVGYFYYHAFSYANGVVTDLGTLGGAMSDAFAVNDSGVAVGSSLLSGNARAHATMYANGKAIDLGSLGDDSIAYGINNAGEAVGSYDLAGTNGTTRHAFVYRNGAMVDLNTLIDPASGWTIDTAIAINDQHQIAATGCNASGTCQGLLLSLADYSVSPVPEPATYAALLSGLGLFGVLRRRQRRK